jgi:DNA-binding GntR family transcriptional regulator
MSPIKYAKIKNNGLRYQVYKLIKNNILNGQIKPGQRVIEARIAEKLSISRGPVREAFRDMAKEGLLINVPRKGSFVTECNIKDVEEIYSMRAILEGLAIRRSINYLTKKDIKHLENLRDQMVLANKNKNILEMVEKDISFHKLICYASKHTRLINFWSKMGYQIRIFLITADLNTYEPEKVRQRHNEIIEAIKAKDPDKAEQCIKKHITQVGEEIIDNFKKKRNDFD